VPVLKDTAKPRLQTFSKVHAPLSCTILHCKWPFFRKIAVSKPSLKFALKWVNLLFMRRFCFVLLLFLFAACRQKKDTLFYQVPSSHSNITFNNTVRENDSINPLDMEFLYNGGGVAVGDFNRDGKPDLYFTASQISNKMYLNQGGFRFKDVTKEAAVTGENRWCNAASVVDINNDGWDDVYVCATITKNPAQRTNLFI
jgi:hypothetical protein